MIYEKVGRYWVVEKIGGHGAWNVEKHWFEVVNEFGIVVSTSISYSIARAEAHVLSDMDESYLTRCVEDIICGNTKTN